MIEELGGGGNLLAHYTQGAGIDDPLAMTGAGGTYFYHADGLGSITSLTDPAGALAASYVYDSFGKLSGSTGTVTNAFQYTGRDFDSEAGLYYYRARYYDPTTGRFISEDPVGFLAGVNFYEYAANSPSNLIDPTGLRQMKPCCPKREEKNILALAESAREQINILEAGGKYRARHGQELARTTCLGFREPNGKPNAGPAGQAVTTMHVDPDQEPCVYECVLKHEMVHQRQCATFGTRLYRVPVQQQEIPAFTMELGCYIKMIREGGLGRSQ